MIRPLIRPFLVVFEFLLRIFWSGLNKRGVFGLVLNFWINFLPVFIWLLIFKNAGLIPKEIRPPIHVKLAYHLDEYMYNVSKYPFGLLATLLGCSLGSYMMYRKLKLIDANTALKNSFNSVLSLDLELNEFNIDETGSESTSGTESDYFDKYSPPISGSFKPKNCWYLAPVFILSASWFVLNLAYWAREPILIEKDLTAWFSYVLCHILAPIFTAIWLYVFHPQGALKLFLIALGVQNIAGVMTHLLFPNAPPWFIHLNSEDLPADYDMPAFAAGLTRIDVALGTHIHSKGFHALPIVFGALPSLHSAMAVQVCFFLCYYARWSILKCFGLAYIALQWWATIYLDHHWRLDLFVGMLYSIALYMFLHIWKGGFRRVDERFALARSRMDFAEGSTMGMRVFRGTRIEHFFDPLS